MKTSLALLCFGLMVGVVRAEDPPEQALTPKQSLQRWAASLLDGELDRTIAFYEDSRDVVAIQSRGHVRKGLAAIREEYQAAFDEVVFQAVSLEELRVRQNGDVAWATCQFKADTLLKSDKTKWTLHVRASFVLQRSSDAWKITLEHLSPMAGVPRVRRRQ